MHYYGIKLLGLAMIVVLLISLIAYCLYIFTANNLPANNSMILTIPFVAFGLFRYQSLVRSKGFGERPELIFFEDKILLAQDVCWKTQLKAYGGPGYSFILEKFLPYLRSKGVSDPQIDKMMVGNPMEVLTLADAS